MCPPHILLLQPIHKRREVRQHGAGREALACGLAEELVAVHRSAGRQDCLEEIAYLLTPEVVRVARVFVEDLASDMVVELKEQHERQRVVVVLRRVVVDVGLRGRVVKDTADGSTGIVRRRDALVPAFKLPPTGIPLLTRQLVDIQIVLELRHHARRPRNEDHIIEGFL